MKIRKMEIRRAPCAAIAVIAVTAALSCVTADRGFAETEMRMSLKATIELPKPAFQSHGPASDIFVSSFGLRGSDAIYRIANPGGVLKGKDARVELATDAIVWPNEAKWFDEPEFGAPGLLVASGFLFPPKSTGSLAFLDVAGRLSAFVRPKRGWFYHRSEAVDWSGSGRRDILTARSQIPPFGTPKGELIWLKRPARPLDEPWQEVLLARGPDMHFRVARNEADGAWIVVAAEFGGRRISLHWSEPDGRVRSRIVDNTLGAAFDLEFADLDGDGRSELLATNHENSARRSAVFAYLVPRDMKSGVWERKTLLSGIETRQLGIGQASPGAARAFFPRLSDTGKTKPWIVVSGDGSQRAYLLRPRSEGRGDWVYEASEILDPKSTVGEPLIGDFDGDGMADVSIPAYDANRIYFFSAERR